MTDPDELVKAAYSRLSAHLAPGHDQLEVVQTLTRLESLGRAAGMTARGGGRPQAVACAGCGRAVAFCPACFVREAGRRGASQLGERAYERLLELVGRRLGLVPAEAPEDEDEDEEGNPDGF